MVYFYCLYKSGGGRTLKRVLATALVLLMIFPMTARGEKLKKLPDYFQVKYQTIEHYENGKESFVSKEHITTCRGDVDEEINGLVDDFDAEMGPLLRPDEAENPRRNSRLDVHVVHSVSGESCVSFLVLARETYRRVQKQSPFVTRTFDMATGRQLSLSDFFDDYSEAWDILAEHVYSQLSAYFPQEEADEETLNALCDRDALEGTPFMLGPVGLTLHYEARTLYPSHPSLMRVFVPYTAIRGYMTDYGFRQTDNSMYRMVALTFDDGPAYATTANLLNYLRQGGAVATFFLVGERIAEYEDITLRENDENHSLQSHHFKHSDTTKSTPARIQAYTQRAYDTFTQLFGLAPVMLRPPYGLSEPFVQAKVNLPIIEWDVDTKDWTGKSTAGVLSVLKTEVKDGSIILMHDIKENTPDAARAVVDWLKQNGYLCVTVEDLALQYGQHLQPNRVYFSIDPDYASRQEE